MPQYREKTWRTPNRMNINTGHSMFDRQCDSISTGNVVGNVQFSNYIRPETETINPVNQVVPPGHLRQFDLKLFDNLPYAIRQWYNDHPDVNTILYQFRHFRGGNKIVHGYVITAGHDEHHKLLFRWDNGKAKSRAVIDECITYITPAKTPACVTST